MLTTSCRCSAVAEAALRERIGFPSAAPFGDVEVEFKEVPYFIVSRSRQKPWDASRGDISRMDVVGVSTDGLVVDPDVPPADTRRTLIPWSNIISLTISGASAGAPEGS